MNKRIDLNGVWWSQPLAWTTLHTDGSISEQVANLPPAGEMQLPMNWQKRGLDSFDGRVRFLRTFAAPTLSADERAFLVFRGVDYFADVTLNGRRLGRHAGYFQPFEFEITDILRSGENELQVDVDCPLEEPGAVWPDHKWVIKGILNHWDARPGSWDPMTGQAQNSGGIWGDVYVDVRPVAFVTNVRAAATLTPKEASDSFFNAADEHASGLQAIVRVEFDVDSTQNGDYPLRVALDEHAVATTLPVTRGRSHHVVVLHVADPQLWWPWDIGTPYLYTLTVELGVARWETLFGIRQIDLDPHTGHWTVNGRRFFLRGTNVIPTLWLGEYDAAMIDRDIELLKAAHINGVRVCVHINRDEFYTACDRAGIVVWQDFALQWAYTTDPRFTQEAVRQVQEMVNHFLMRQFILAVPDDYIDAGRIDGASELRIYFQIVVPLIQPALITLAIVVFVASWDEFLWMLIVTTGDALRTLPVGLAKFVEQYRTRYELMMAGSVVAAAPVVLLFLAVQRRFLQGMAGLSGLK